MPESVYAKKGDMGPQDHLSQDEVQAVVAYIKNFSPKFAARHSPESLLFHLRRRVRPRQLTVADESTGRRDALYATDPRGAETAPRRATFPVKPTDLTQRPLKSGSIPRDIFRSILTGLDGTPMPSYHLTLEDDEL